MLQKFRARRMMAKRSKFEQSVDRVLNACWNDIKKEAGDAETKGRLAVFCFCILNSFEVIRTFGSHRLEVAKALQVGGVDIVAIELALLGLARASLDEDKEDEFAEVIVCGHRVLTTIACEPYKSMEYEEFIEHFIPLIDLDVKKAISETAARIARRLDLLPEPLAGPLASGVS